MTIDVKKLRKAAENHKKYDIEIPVDSYIALLDRLDAAETKLENLEVNDAEVINTLIEERDEYKRKLAKAEKAANHWTQEAISYKEQARTLAAHAERLSELLERAQTGLDWYYDTYPEVHSSADGEHAAEVKATLAAAPETSLAKLIAEKQAEVLEALRLDDCTTLQDVMDRRANEVSELRQQANK